MTRWIPTVLALLAALTAMTAGPASGRGAELRVEAATVDLGPVLAGDVATARFVLFNDSEREVRIVRAAPS